MKIEIKNRWTGGVIFSGEFGSLRLAVEHCAKGKISLRDSDLSDSNLSGSNLSDSNLSGSNLRDSDLSDSNLRNSNLSGSNLRNSNLRNSNLSDSNLSDSNLSDSNLRNSDLSGSIHFKSAPHEPIQHHEEILSFEDAIAKAEHQLTMPI